MPTRKINARQNTSIGTGVVDLLKSSLHIWLITIYTPLKGVVGNTKTIMKENKRKRGREMNAKETLNLISKQWCDLNDLRKLTGLGKNNAIKLKNEIKIDLENKGYLLPNKLLPMNEVVSYLKINISYLQKMAKEVIN